MVPRQRDERELAELHRAHLGEVDDIGEPLLGLAQPLVEVGAALGVAQHHQHRELSHGQLAEHARDARRVFADVAGHDDRVGLLFDEE